MSSRLAPFVASLRTIEFARLEYGKPCESSSGPIKKLEECRTLAQSATFPEWITALCRPVDLGLGLQEGAEVAAERFGHGTVVRPVKTPQGAIAQVAYRLRRRSEDGESRPGRRYWLGRYLYSAEITTPLTALTALDCNPLIALTDYAQQASSVSVDESHAPIPPHTEFLEQAIVFCLAGIPIGVQAPLDEKEFFELAAFLRFCLPPTLQPLFSTGWGVSRDLSQELHCSIALSFPDTVAVYQPERRAWIPPKTSPPNHGSGAGKRPSLRDEHLMSGHMYLREAFEWSPQGRPLTENGPQRLDSFGIFDFSPSLADLVTTPGLQTPVIASAFQSAGLRALDFARLTELSRWLDGELVDEGRLCRAPDDYFFHDYRERVVKLAVSALSQDNQRAKGDLMVWGAAEGPSASYLTNLLVGCDERTNTRAKLLLAISRDAPAAMLQTLGEAAAVGEVADLPDLAQLKFEKKLDLTLRDFSRLDVHIELLTGARALPYTKWAQRRMGLLALVLGSSYPDEIHQYISRLDTDHGPLWKLAARLTRREQPIETDVGLLVKLNPTQREMIERSIREYWLRGEAVVRTKLLPWVALATVRSDDEPIWQLAHGRDPRNHRPATEIARLIDPERIPASLLFRVAELALSEWQFFEPIVRQAPGGWARVFEHWPAEVRHLLLVQSLGSSSVDSVPSFLPEMSLAQFDQLLADWSHSRLPADVVANALSTILRSGTPTPLPGRSVIPPSVLGICRQLRQGVWWFGQTPSDGITDIAAAVVRRLGLQWPKNTITTLWREANSGWRVRSMLQLFPTTELRPSAKHLEHLIPHRTWLIEHLQRLPARREDYGIATVGFHALTFDTQNGRYAWKQEYSTSAIWAAFAGVPTQQQGSLAHAISAYGNRDIPSSLGLAHRYLEGSRLQADRSIQFAARRVLDAVVRPLLHARLGSAQSADLLEVYGLKSEWTLQERLSFGLGAMEIVLDKQAADTDGVAATARSVSVSPLLDHLLREVAAELVQPRVARW
ncbi:MAG: hypothetical protein WC815_04110 [Vicinamibacterales bacterium]|jgi:hypothetical protein